jgi:hypothetical protein
MMGAFLKKIDMFKIPVQLYYKRDLFASKLGGIVTLLVFIFLCVISMPILKNFFSFQNLTHDLVVTR